MWIGIPYTKYKYHFTVPRRIIFSLLATLLYAFLSLPETNMFVGSYIDLSRFDDIESNDRYSLLVIHSIIFGLLLYVLVGVYNPGGTGTIIPKKILPKV